MRYNIIYRDNEALEILEEIGAHMFQNSDSSINQKVLGMYVHQLGADRVVMKERKLLICKTIEEAVIVE